MQINNIRSYTDYYHYALYNPAGEDEWQLLLELLLNHETSFFRHPPALAALTGHLLPNLLRFEQQGGATTISMWSVGCSTGQEPYSLAMVSLETLAGRSVAWDIKILGSDISRPALDQARRGEYNANQVRSLPAAYRRRYMRPLEAGRPGYRVVDPVRALVQFNNCNLVDLANCQVFGQDVIFCQNVLVYFNPEDRLAAVDNLLSRLNRGGYLVLSPLAIEGLRLKNIRRVALPEVLVYQRLA